MSFKEKIIEHCENMERKCDRCPFKTPCDRTSTEAIPKYLTDEEMKTFRDEIFADYYRTCRKLAEMLDFLLFLKEEEKHESNNL